MSPEGVQVGGPPAGRLRRRGGALSVAAAVGVLSLGGLLLGACAGPGARPRAVAPGDDEFVRLSELARAAFDQGAHERAEALYARALARARARDDAAAIGDAAYNLAALRMLRDDRAAAGPLLDEAEAELARAGAPRADVWLLRAKLAAAASRPAEARRWADRAAGEPGAGATAAQRAEAALLRGRLACEAGDAAAGRSELETARGAAPPGNLALAAGMARLSGLVLLLEGRPGEAGAAFDREADAWRAAGGLRAMVQALDRAAEAHAQAGDPGAGADRAYRAARSAYALGEIPAARRLAGRARDLAGTGGDRALMGRIDHLAAEIGGAPPAPDAAPRS